MKDFKRQANNKKTTLCLRIKLVAFIRIWDTEFENDHHIAAVSNFT